MAELLSHFVIRIRGEVHLVLFGINREVFYPIPDSIIVHKPKFRFSNRFRFISTLRTMLFLRQCVKAVRPVSVLSFGEYWNNFVLLSLWGIQVRKVVSDRSQPDKVLSVLHELLRKCLYPQADAIIAQTERARSIYSRLYQHQAIFVIGNPIREIELLSNTRENIVLSVGRLIKSKNHEGLIRTFLSLPPTDWKLVIVGYDHLGERNQAPLENLVHKLGGEGKVEFAGKQSNVDYFYQRAKIFAFMSRSEGFPNAIGEAMTAALPVVAFDCSAGPSEMIVDGRNGFLVPMDDYDVFRSRLFELMSDDLRSRAMGEQARMDIRKFSISRVGEQYLDVLVGNKSTDQ